MAKRYRIELRVNAEERELFIKCAEEYGFTLTQWCLYSLFRSATYHQMLPKKVKDRRKKIHELHRDGKYSEALEEIIKDLRER